ncbi:hypothetical protein RI129_007261 [Pyrocoelia pectoralis]|uniref:MACPF domain-containing protein n=1 Tax=Pyrocoelia pectoralis TaxID=417401 RepID=A0AAN7ZME6_9COLE
MWGRALLLVLVIAFTADGEGVQESSYDAQLKVGRSIDIFTRYGYLSLSMKVVPRNESDSNWIFREPTVDVFTDINPLIIRPQLAGKKSVFEGDFHMEFCDNLRQLLQAYFRDFTFERMQRPWRAFTASWTQETISKHLGINSSFVHGDHCYVLVRLSRFRDTAKLSRLPNNISISETVAREIDNVRVGDVTSALVFMRKYGSHFINSFVTGNSLYQVFVYERSVYREIKDRLKTHGISNLSNVELSNFFSPWYAQHMGKIKVASGNKTVESWCVTKLRVHYYIFSYPSLLKIHGNPQLLSVLNGLLQNEALLQLDMRSLAPAFKDTEKQEWFEEVLDNYLKLWEVNL